MATATARDERRRAGEAERARGGGPAPQEHAAPRSGSPLVYLDEADVAPGPEADSASDSGDSDSDDALSTSSWTSSLAAREAQQQWDDSVRQLQALVNLVAVPWVSRYFGRKWAYSLFERYLDIGLGKRFWLGPLAQYAPVSWR
ncbi:hypothetical protein JCM8208_004730 [Rhodotorula glutinis]